MANQNKVNTHDPSEAWENGLLSTLNQKPPTYIR